MSIQPVKLSRSMWYPRKIRGMKAWRKASKLPGLYWEIVRVGHKKFNLARYLHCSDGSRICLSFVEANFDRLNNAARCVEEE